MAGLYEELVGAAEAGVSGSELGSIIARAFAAGWETGDVFEALGEGGYDLSFGAIEGLAQKAAISGG